MELNDLEKDKFTTVDSETTVRVTQAEGALPGFNVPPYDYIILTYVTTGNGIGEIETVTYKLGGSGGTVVAILTLAYDANDKLSTVTGT